MPIDDFTSDLAGHFKNILRHRQIIICSLLAVGSVAAISWMIEGVADRQPSSTVTNQVALASGTSADQLKPEPEEKNFRSQETIIKSGTNIYTLLVEAGLPPTDVIQLTDSFRQVVDLAKCKPGEVITINRDTEGSIVSISYQKEPLELILADKIGDGWNIVRRPVNYREELERISGVVENSLFQAMESLGEKDALTIALVDILAWEIDFAHESRPGDTFSLLVEKYYVEGEHVGYGPILAAEYRMGKRTVRAYALKNSQGKTDYFDEDGHSLKKSFLKSPLRYSRISSGYSKKRLHPVTGKIQPHYAIDYAAPVGTPIWAVADGAVREMRRDRYSGRKLAISHPGGYISYYLHLSRFARGLKVGRRVSQKQIVGYVGATGRVTGPHLDYRLNKHGTFVNPLKEEFPRAEPIVQERREEFSRWVSWLKTLFQESSS